jgi:hypothetical protein
MAIALAGYPFDGPFDDMEDTQDQPGVFAVVCGAVQPQVHVVDVGEADRIRERLQTHERTPCWERDCEEIRYVAHYTPNLDAEARQRIEAEIREEYDPVCGSMAEDASDDFSRRKSGGPTGPTP